MGRASQPGVVKIFLGILVARPALIGEIEAVLIERLGPVDVRSEVLDFGYTDYYEGEMGKGLKRNFLGFRNLVAPDRLVDIKLWTNGLEGSAFCHEGRRWVNLDPGYLTPAKVVLATTKDYAHRLYLGSGIYGEVTLTYRDGRFEPLPWTYPDYRSGDYDAFFLQLRATYMRQIGRERKLTG